MSTAIRSRLRTGLYATSDRLACRTDALRRAKISGRHVADVIAELAPRTASVVADIGSDAAPRPRCSHRVFPRRRHRRRCLSRAAGGPLGSECLVRGSSAPTSLMPLASASCEYPSRPSASTTHVRPRVVPPRSHGALSRGNRDSGDQSADSYRELDALVSRAAWIRQPTSEPACTRRQQREPSRLSGESCMYVESSMNGTFRFGNVDLAEYLPPPKYVLAEDYRTIPQTSLTSSARTFRRPSATSCRHIRNREPTMTKSSPSRTTVGRLPRRGGQPPLAERTRCEAPALVASGRTSWTSPPYWPARQPADSCRGRYLAGACSRSAAQLHEARLDTWYVAGSGHRSAALRTRLRAIEARLGSGLVPILC